jgi:calcineurin-like phosphoesterase family protein
MTTTFVVADLHFGHEGMCRFLAEDGTKIRPWDNLKDMDEALIANWNTVVRPTDKVYVLGDVAMKSKHLPSIHECRGEKILIKGNHDQGKLNEYVRYFRDIRACHQLSGCLLSHIPIHPDSLARWRANIHGHLHTRQVMTSGVPDPRYICVSVEQTGFRPIAWDDVLKRLPAPCPYGQRGCPGGAACTCALPVAAGTGS